MKAKSCEVGEQRRTVRLPKRLAEDLGLVRRVSLWTWRRRGTKLWRSKPT